MMKILISILLVLFFSLQYNLWFGRGSFGEINYLNQLIESQRAENRDLQERNRLLTLEVLNLKQGGDAIEERARRELGMIKKDEIFIQVIEK